MSVGNLLMRYIRMAVAEAKLARVPNQFVEPDSAEGDRNEDVAGDVNEFSGVGSIAGYTGPLGMDLDKLGRKKNARPK